MKGTHTIQTETRVIAEWNMNVPGNIQEVGNYRNRRAGDIDYPTIPDVWNEDDPYTQGATDADTTIISTFADEDGPIAFTEKKEKMKTLYSLDDCVKQQRPRSGINKPLYLGYTASSSATAQYVNNYGSDIDKRPRYYMGSRDDRFKYWTSYRTENENEYGISSEGNISPYLIEDVAPYVVYKEPVPCNRIVVKMQTNVGTKNHGPFRMGNDIKDDPLFGMDNATIPANWRVQVLVGNKWEPAASLTNDDITEDGHVELSLGWKLPDNYRIKGEMPSFTSLYPTGEKGDTYFILDEGVFYVYKDKQWERLILDREQQVWKVESATTTNQTPVVTELIKKDQKVVYPASSRQEFVFIKGIRIVVDDMQNPNTTFDLIEMSPRLVADVTDRTQSFNVSSTMADLGSKTLPVGDLVVSTGTIELNNNDGAFSYESKDSIISNFLYNAIKFKFYDVVKNPGHEMHIPIKTLYSQGFPQATGNFDNVSMQMRDAYGILESEQAPELFLQDISLSFAVTMLLDSVGFSNYKFFRGVVKKDTPTGYEYVTEDETIIPFFFISPGRSVADVLRDLAVATQTTMWFNEYNDFCVASKNWSLPSIGRVSDDGVLITEASGVLRGNDSEKENGVSHELANIIAISSDEKRVANDGAINYTERYIQREKASLEQSMHTTRWNNWIYKPTMLWEASGTQNLRDYNTVSKEGAAYNLTAIPLESNLNDVLPVVEGGVLKNNIIDFGEGITWMGRENGYFYANGEIIKFDAMEYAITGVGVRWITNNDEYQDYFANLPFRGKIYPTGKVRIYAEPYYNEDGSFQEGEVKQHGRGQFGTPIVTHAAGVSDYWIDNDNCYGMLMDSKVLFSADSARGYSLNLKQPRISTMSTMTEERKGEINAKARGSERKGIIKNFLADTYQVEQENKRFNTTRKGTVQASSLVFEGPSEFPTVDAESSIQTNSVDNISYVLKDFTKRTRDYDPFYKPYRHFGTRMRVVGELTSDSNTKQKAVGAQNYVSLQPDNPQEQTTLVGGSGGIGVMVNPTNNQGYFFEIVALSQDAQDRTLSNKVYPVTGTVRGKSVNLKTGEEHNIKSGDQFVIINGADSSEAKITSIAGIWEAESVTKDSVNLRIEKASDGTIALSDGVKIRKVESLPTSMSTMFFYKMMEDDDGTLVPYVLWEGIGEILCDDGMFTDIQRFVGQEKTSVYDLAVEFKDVNDNRMFYLYLNGRQIATVVDDEPIINPSNSVALFTRGTSKCMFNNVYGLADHFSENTAAKIVDKVDDVFGTNTITNSEAMRKYSVTGFVQSSYLSGVNTVSSPDYDIYFEEFGTIMRECDYLNIKYDQAFPALAAQLAPVMNDAKSYVVSGFRAGAYGAEFLIFNTTDAVINLSAETGAFLRILGVSFTQDTTKSLTVDDYYGQVARLDRPQMAGSELIGNPTKYKEQYDKILESRAKYGKQEFESIESEYIQDDAVAEDILGWIINKTKQPRQLVGTQLFGMSHMQLGDVFNIDYKVDPTNATQMDAITDANKKFVTYQIDFTKDQNGVNMTAYLVEV